MSNEAQKKIDPRISIIFLEMKYLKTPDNNNDLTAALETYF